MRAKKFNETEPGTYRTSLRPASRLEFFPYIPSRPEAKDIPWTAARRESLEHAEFVGACVHDGARHFFFQERGNAEAIVVVRQVNS